MTETTAPAPFDDHPLKKLVSRLLEDATPMLDGVELVITAHHEAWPREPLTLTNVTPAWAVELARAGVSQLEERDPGRGDTIYHRLDALAIKVQNLTTAFHELGRVVAQQSVQMGQLLEAIAAEGAAEEEDTPALDLDGNPGGRARDPGQSLG